MLPFIWAHWKPILDAAAVVATAISGGWVTWLWTRSVIAKANVGRANQKIKVNDDSHNYQAGRDVASGGPHGPGDTEDD